MLKNKVNAYIQKGDEVVVIQLNPCSRCGEQAAVMKSSDGWGWYIKCGGSSSSKPHPICINSETKTYFDLYRAIYEWNSRGIAKEVLNKWELEDRAIDQMGKDSLVITQLYSIFLVLWLAFTAYIGASWRMFGLSNSLIVLMFPWVVSGLIGIGFWGTWRLE